jgi:uncharacterized damage-inducible protein DinB
MNMKKITAGILSTVAALAMLACEKPAPTTPEAVAPSTTRVNMMVADWERAKNYTKAYLDSSNDKSIAYKLSAKTPRSFGDQLLHMAEANYGLVMAATGKTTELGFGKLEGKDGFKSKEEVTKAIMDSYDYVIGALKDLDDNKLADTISVELFPGFKPTMSREAMINKAFEHQTHHRGQTTQYLRAQGLTPPQEMLF